jgi:hypothetical protein
MGGSPGQGRNALTDRDPRDLVAKTPPAIRRPTPRLGAHTIEILGEWLGMDAAEARTYAWPAGHSEPLRARRPLAEDSWPERPEDASLIAVAGRIIEPMAPGTPPTAGKPYPGRFWKN